MEIQDGYQVQDGNPRWLFKIENQDGDSRRIPKMEIQTVSTFFKQNLRVFVSSDLLSILCIL